MEDIDRPPVTQWPVLFCVAIVAPFIIVAVGSAIAPRYMPSDRGSYTPLNIILAFVLAEIVITWTLLIWGWLRGERPRWLASFGAVMSIASVWRIF